MQIWLALGSGGTTRPGMGDPEPFCPEGVLSVLGELRSSSKIRSVADRLDMGFWPVLLCLAFLGLSDLAGDFPDLCGVASSSKKSMAVKLLCDSLMDTSACNSSSSNSSLFLFLPFWDNGSLRVALSSLHKARDSPNASTVLDEDVCNSSLLESTAVGSVWVRRARDTEVCGGLRGRSPEPARFTVDAGSVIFQLF